MFSYLFYHRSGHTERKICNMREENKTAGKRPGFENMSASSKLKLIQIYHSCMVMAKIR
jgi:hypothetical protein